MCVCFLQKPSWCFSNHYRPLAREIISTYWPWHIISAFAETLSRAFGRAFSLRFVRKLATHSTVALSFANYTVAYY